MARPGFRDRFYTRPVARAMTAPSSILLAGAGAAVAIAVGLPLIAAPIAGAAAWAARVATSIPKAEARTRVDPFAVPEPWRRFVVEAMKSGVRYDQAIADAGSGPIRDRLDSIGERLQDGVEEVARIANRAAQLTRARKAIDADDAARDLARLDAETGDAGPAPGTPLARTAEALRSQVDAAARLDGAIADARSQLRLLDARLDELVARAIEMQVQVDDVEELGQIDADVEGLVSEMEALRLALEETGRAQGQVAEG